MMKMDEYLIYKKLPSNGGNGGNGFDPKFKYEISHQSGGEHIMKCYQCGTCAGICPIFEVEEEYYPQKIIKMALLGMREEVLSSNSIWLCSTCYGCYEHCPQDVKVTELMCAIQNIATKDGYLAPALEDKIKLLKEHARTLPLDAFDNKKRSKFDLPAIEEKPGDIAKIIEETGIEELVKHKREVPEPNGPGTTQETAPEPAAESTTDSAPVPPQENTVNNTPLEPPPETSDEAPERDQ
jgi:heterodisulfide reductase subunit C